MKQAFFPKLNELPIIRDDIPVPRPADDQVLIKVKMASICNLTDTHTITGEHPPHNLWAEGYFTNPPNSFPAPIGHEGAGEIVEVGKGVKTLKVGDRVCSVHISDMMSEYVNVASKYNIQSIQAYELYDDAEGAYGMMEADGHTQKPAYGSYLSFVQSHPR